MTTTKQRNHNEWFRPVMESRKSCPTCKAKAPQFTGVWSWGEYLHGRWRTVKHFCQACYETKVKAPLLEHAGDCGCNITLVGKHGPLPGWLTLDEKDISCDARRSRTAQSN